MASTLRSLLPALALVVAVAACGAPRIPYALVGQTNVVTLTNLHPDGRRLYSSNYQQAGLIPLCTPVVIQVVSDRKMVFTDTSTGTEYQYLFEGRRMGEPVPEHLDRYFGTACPDVSGLNDADKAGIQDGKIYAGMTREGVLLAAGYPSLRETDLESDVWKFYESRYDAFEVIFVDGLVQFVRD